MQDQGKELERFKRDREFYEACRQQLLEQYPEQWIAIFDEQVVGVSPDVEHLLTDLKTRGIPVGRALVEHATRHEELLILWL